MRLNLRQLFVQLPLPLKKQAINGAGWLVNRRRYGKFFHAYQQQFREGKGLKGEEMRALITRVAQNHPYFREFSIDSFDDIPIVTKSDIMSHHDKFLINKSLVFEKATTSGTTGQRFEFSLTKEMLQKQYAGAWFFREIHGLYREEPQANFFGRSLFDINQTQPPFWLFSKPTNQLLFSELHLTRERAPLYLEQLHNYGVRWFHGFPSFVSLFASFIAEQGLIPEAQSLNLKGITLSSENLLKNQRRIIEEVFGCRVINFYSQGEGVADIYQDSDGLLKVNENYSYVEFIPNGDGLFRIVGTQLDNKCMPFIRYDTGDLAELEEDPREGVAPKIKSIMGRKSEFLVLKNGRKVGRLGHIFHKSHHIREAQIVQTEPGKALFLINPTDMFSPTDQQGFEYEIRRKLGDDFDFEIRLVDAIQRTASGKLKLVESSLIQTTG